MSYLEFYKLEEPPFANVPDLRFFYGRPPYDESITRIQNSITTLKRLVLVVGGCGLGKTIISRKILSEFEESENYEANLLVCLHSDMKAGWLLHKLATALHLNHEDISVNDLFKMVTDKFLEIGRNKHIIMIIDEANMIESQAVFDEIRGIIDFMADNRQNFTVMFFGLPVLEGKIALNEPLYHRIESKITLKSLNSTNDVREYIDHRMKIAGSTEKIFTDEAYRYIYETSRGNPRMINIICDNTLTEGYLTKTKAIGEHEVERVVIEMGYNTRLKSLFVDAETQQLQQPPPR